MGVSQIGGFTMENSLKMDAKWGYLHFKNSPNMDEQPPETMAFCNSYERMGLMSMQDDGDPANESTQCINPGLTL